MTAYTVTSEPFFLCDGVREYHAQTFAALLGIREPVKIGDTLRSLTADEERQSREHNGPAETDSIELMDTEGRVRSIDRSCITEVAA